MSLEQIFAHFQQGGYVAAAALDASSAEEQFYLALLAFADQDLAAAARHAQSAASQQPGRRVYAESARYLAQAGERQGVYVAPEAFSAFIRGGGNLPLYAATSAALRAAHQRAQARSLLDVGVGDGLALLPALSSAITELDLLEPSAALLEATSRALSARGVAHRAHNQSLQAFVEHAEGHWDVIEATFSLQSIEPSERVPLLAWLRAHGGRLLIAEFDAPAFAEAHGPARATYVAERFELGLAEYADDGGLVAQGFLIPVMLGYFDRTAARTNYEHPLAEWQAQLRAAGFTQITIQPLYAYWWAQAGLIEAMG